MFSNSTKHLKQVIFCSLLVVAMTSCKKDKDPNPGASEFDTKKQEVVNNYAEIVYASYLDSYNKALVLKEKVNAFVANPSAQGLADAKTAWLDARVPYLQTEAYRFYGGPIDDENGPEGLLNAWPMDEAYIDYVEGNAGAGIINNLDIKITKDTLEYLNEGGAEVNISVGYHAIEFLLWGQDVYTDGPGKRPYTDYVKTGGGTAKNQERRADYLSIVTGLLVDDLDYLVKAWAPEGNNYRKQFVSAPTDESIKNILIGIGSLSGGELAGERMQVAVETQAQEDEHSCFSDNTTNDIIYDAVGIENVYYGKYTKTDGTVINGPGIDELIGKKDATLNAKMIAQLTATNTGTHSIHAPFDQEILSVDGRARIILVIKSLQEQTNIIVQIADKLGLKLSL